MQAINITLKYQCSSSHSCEIHKNTVILKNINPEVQGHILLEILVNIFYWYYNIWHVTEKHMQKTWNKSHQYTRTSVYNFYAYRLRWSCRGAIGRASDLRFKGYELWLGVTVHHLPLGKLLTPVCLCHQAV